MLRRIISMLVRTIIKASWHLADTEEVYSAYESRLYSQANDVSSLDYSTPLCNPIKGTRHLAKQLLCFSLQHAVNFECAAYGHTGVRTSHCSSRLASTWFTEKLMLENMLLQPQPRLSAMLVEQVTWISLPESFSNLMTLSKVLWHSASQSLNVFSRPLSSAHSRGVN